MPSKKQRRRQQKERRHEYEYVYVDAEGREVEASEGDDGEPAGTATRPQRAAATQARQTRAKGGRPVRKVDPPNWRKVTRRAAIFGPIMLVVVYLLKPKDSSILNVLGQTAVLMAFFIPFSYLMDRMMYRTYLRKTGQEPPRPQTRRR